MMPARATVADLGDLSPSQVRAVVANGGLLEMPPTVRAVLTDVDRDVRIYPTVPAMAHAAGLSQPMFSRTVLATTGMTAEEYLTAARLVQAKALLAGTDLSVTAVSVRVGYSHIQSLGDLFGRELGMSPTAYRRRVRP